MDKVLSEKVALISEKHLLRAQVYNLHFQIFYFSKLLTFFLQVSLMCNLTQEQSDLLLLTSEELFPNYIAWILQKGLPFQKRFTIFIEEIQGNGLLELFYSRARKRILPKANQVSIRQTIHQLKLGDFLYLAKGLFIGLALASLILIVEIVIDKYKAFVCKNSN